MKPNKLLKKLMVLMTLFFLGFSYQTIAQTMMPISTHSSSYAGYVRGYWFIAPTDFTITGLKIPTEAGTGTQNIQVMKIHSGGVAVFSTEGINFTTLFYVNNAPNNVIQSTAITVNAGDTIGILGQAGNSNSYSPSMNPSFSSTIAGMPVELTRFIYQGEITAGEAPWYSSELSGSLGRVEMYYTTAPCAGQPTAGTVPATIATCPSQPFTIQATGATAAGSMANKWQQSPAGQNTWTDVAGATMSTFGSSGITTATDYRYITTCTPSALSDTSDVVSVTILPSSACYCEPIHTYGCSNGAQVGGVTTTLGLTNISNTNTGCGSLTSIAYSDYSATHSASAAHSNLVNIKVDVSNYSGGVKVWIDWNQNGIFETNEIVAESPSTISSGSFYQTNFTVPSTATVGATKMRVRVVESTTTFDACSTQNYGEAEDYEFVVIQGVPCAGMPSIDTIQGPNEICALTPFALSMTPIMETDINYVWQSSPAGTNTWATITGASQAAYTVTNGISTATDYRLIVTCTNSNLSDTTDVHAVTMAPGTSCYCEPIHTYGCSNGAQVGGVTTTLGTTNISNTGTGCGSLTSTAYSDYSATHSASAAHSNLVNIKVDVANYSGGVKIWVDWNQNGIFEANELVGESASTISSGSFYQTNFTVPSTAVVGTTKMRVRVVESTTTFDACSTQSYGEAEDYGFVVIQGTPCAGMPSIDTIQGPTDVCALDPFSLSMTPIFQTDISYVWQSSPAGTNTWTNITGATQALYSATNGITTATDYRLIVTCTNSNLSDTTDVKEVGMTPVNQCYCEPSSLYGEYTSAFSTTNAIQNVNFTASSAFQYQNLSGTDTIIAEAGSTFDISHTYVGGSNTVRVWVDWDENGVFDPVAEEVYSNYISSASQTGTITIPTNTPNGSYRLRVRSRWSTSVFGPCTVESYGSAIDYTLKVQGLCTDPIVNLGPNVTICAGETITLDAGNAGLDFEWNDNSTGQTLEVSASGTYYVTVSEDDCSTTDSVVVTVQPLPTVDLGGDVSICEGESITLDAGNAGANFEWSDNSTGQTLDVTAEGTYSVIVTEGTCFASDTVAVSYIDAPTADGIIANEQEDCFFTFSVDNAQNVVYYEWDFGDGSPATIGAAVNYNYPQSGTYDVTLDMVSSCGDTLTLTKVVKCDNGIGIDEVIADKNAVTLYPNPTTDLVTIESENNLSMEQVTVYNVLGQKVYQNTPMSPFKHSIDVSKMASGVYTIHVQTNDGVIIRKFEIIK